MSVSTVAHLNFTGDAREALAFYHSVFGGQVMIATYAQVGSDPTEYQDLMYIGLQTSTLYQEEIIAKGLQPAVQANWGKLNEGGKCND